MKKLTIRMTITMTITITITKTKTMTFKAMTMMMVMVTMIIITFPLFTRAILIAQKLVGPRRTPTGRRQTSWLFKSIIEELYAELQ